MYASDVKLIYIHESHQWPIYFRVHTVQVLIRLNVISESGFYNKKDIALKDIDCPEKKNIAWLVQAFPEGG